MVLLAVSGRSAVIVRMSGMAGEERRFIGIYFGSRVWGDRWQEVISIISNNIISSLSVCQDTC